MTDAQFIVFEGLDGSGTSTQIQALREYFVERNIEVCLTHEPTDEGHIGTILRQALKKEWSPTPEALQLLFSADRAVHLDQVIEPALEAGHQVICDRYILSTLAFGSLNLPLPWLESLGSEFRTPDLTIFFDVPVDMCLERINKRGEAEEMFEKKELLRKVDANYRKLIEGDETVVTIDGTGTPEEVFDLIIKVFQEKSIV